jgi:hypothetical protein
MNRVLKVFHQQRPEYLALFSEAFHLHGVKRGSPRPRVVSFFKFGDCGMNARSMGRSQLFSRQEMSSRQVNTAAQRNILLLPLPQVVDESGVTSDG